MLDLALKMLLGDKAKYIMLISGLTFASLLMTEQAGIFCGIMQWTGSTLDNVGAPIDDELRRVDASGAERSRILLLPLGVAGGRERIGPAKVVPVVHVPLERDHGNAGHPSLASHARKQPICRRTARTSFGREELEQHRDRRRSLGRLLFGSAASGGPAETENPSDKPDQSRQSADASHTNHAPW